MAGKRRDIGSVIKGKDGKPDYIKISQDVTLKKGQYLNLETKARQLENLQKSVASGKLSTDLGEKIKERLENTPEWVRFNISVTEEV